jgi:uncharacterized membrane protein
VQTLRQIIEVLVMIAGLMAIVAGLFYAFSWLMLLVVSLFPMIGKRHRHSRWDDLTRRSGRG